MDESLHTEKSTVNFVHMDWK